MSGRKRFHLRHPRKRGAPPCVGCAQNATPAGTDASSQLIEPVGVPEPTAVPVRGADVQHGVLGESLMLLDPDTGRFVVLSMSAALVYTSVDGTSSVAEISRVLAEETHTDPAVVAAGVTDALGSLEREGLVWFDVAGADPAGTTNRASGNRDTAELGAADPDGVDRDALDESAIGDASSDQRRLARVDKWDAVRLARLDAADWPIIRGPLLAGAAVIVVRMADSSVAGLLDECLAVLPCAPAGAPVDVAISISGTGQRGPLRVFLGGARFERTTSAALAAEVTLSACNQAAASYPRNVMRMHAGLAARNGTAVMVCGASGRGKSSLTTALVRNGWDYVTDEVGVINPGTGDVTPYAKWIDLNIDAAELVGVDVLLGRGSDEFELHIPPDAIGTVATGAVHIGAVVILDPTSRPPDEADQPFQPTALTGTDALGALLPNVFPGTWDDEENLQGLADLCSRIPVVTMRRAPLDVMVTAVEQLLAETGS